MRDLPIDDLEIDSGLYEGDECPRLNLSSAVKNLKEYRQAIHEGKIIPPIIPNEDKKVNFISTLTQEISREKLEFLTYKYHEFLERFGYEPINCGEEHKGINANNFFNIFKKIGNEEFDNINPLYFILRNFSYTIWAGDDEEFDCLEPFQLHILLLIRQQIVLNKKVIRISISGGQGLGKTKLQALVILFYMWLYKHTGIYRCVSVTLDQSTEALFTNGVVRLLMHPQCKIKEAFHLPPGKDKLFMKMDKYERVPIHSSGQLNIVSGSPSNLAGVKGAHAEGITLFMLDEANEIKGEVVDVIKSGLSAHSKSLLMLVSNGCPYTTYFGRLMKDPEFASWHRFTFSVDTAIRTRMNKEELYATCKERSEDHIETHYHGKIITECIDKVFFKVQDVVKIINNGQKLHFIMNRFSPRFAGVDIASGVETSSNKKNINATVIVLRQENYAEVYYYNKTDTNEELNTELFTLVNSGYTIIYDSQGVGLRTIYNLPVFNSHRKSFTQFQNLKLKRPLHVNQVSLLFECVRIWMEGEKSTIKVTPNRFHDHDERKLLEQFRTECMNITYELVNGKLAITPKLRNPHFRDIIDALSFTFLLDTKRYLNP